MSRSAQILIGIMVVMGLLCCVAVPFLVTRAQQLFVRTAQTSAADAAEFGRDIVPYTLPDGYREIAGSDLMGTTSVAIGTDISVSDMRIYLMRNSLVKGGTPAQREQYAAALVVGASQGATFETVDRQDITINGEATTLTIGTRKDERGNTIRRASVLFTSDDAPAAVLIIGSERTWDDDAVAEFLDSIQ